MSTIDPNAEKAAEKLTDEMRTDVEAAWEALQKCWVEDKEGITEDTFKAALAWMWTRGTVAIIQQITTETKSPS